MPLGGVNGRPPPDVVPDVRGKAGHHEAAPERAPLWLLIPLGLAISCIAHVVLLTPVVYFSAANLFDPAPIDAITVDIVSPQEAGEAPKPEAAAADAPPSIGANAGGMASELGQATGTASAPSPATPATRAAPPPSLGPQSAPSARALQQGAARQDADQAQPSSSVLTPAWLPQQVAPAQPEPAQPQETDITNVFAMPLTLPDGRLGGKYDSPAVDRADVSNDAVAAFHNHLKTCSALPAGVAPEVRVVLRVYLKPDGSLATGLPQNPEPIKVEGVSVGGGVLFQHAVAALRKCQPYKMLPPDKYEEWKRLDLTFTPQNF